MQLIGVLLLLIAAFLVIAVGIYVAIFWGICAAIAAPGGGVGVLVGWLMSRFKAKAAAKKLVAENPVGAIVRFGYDTTQHSIVWELDDAQLSSFNADLWFEFLRWLTAILLSVLALCTTLHTTALCDVAWQSVSMSPLNIAHWSFLEWAGSVVSLGIIGYILKKCLPKQARNYREEVKQAAVSLIQRNTPMLRELSELYADAWRATQSASERVGMTDSVTLLASVENNWDGLRSNNLHWHPTAGKIKA